MISAIMKHMASNFAKLDKFKGVDFRRWQKKMHFLLSSMSVVCLIINGISDPLFDIYENVESSKELCDSWEAKYMAEDASSKKFLVSNFTNYNMTYSRPVMEQYNEILGILGRFTQHKMNMDEAIQVSCIIDKLPPSWKDLKHTLKHQKEELTLVEFGNHLLIEESLMVQDNDKLKGNNVVGPLVFNMIVHNNSFRYNDNKGKRKHQDTIDPNKKSKKTSWKYGKPEQLKKDCKDGKIGNKANGSGINGSMDGSTNSLKGHNMFNKSLQVYYVTYVSEAYYVQDDDVVWLNIVNDNIGSTFMLTSKLNDSIPWHDRLGHVHYKRMQDKSKDGLIPAFDMDTGKFVRLPDPKLKTLGERGIECIFVGNADHFKAFKFYVIELNESVSINLIIESRDAIFDENRFSSVPRPSLRIPNGTEDIGGSVVPEEVNKEVVKQPEPEIRTCKMNKTPKNFKIEFQLYLIEGTRDEIDSIMGNNTWVLADLPPDYKPFGCKWIFKRKLKVDETIKKFKARLVIQGFRQKSWIDYFDTYAPVARISTIRLLISMESIHNLIIHQMDVKTTFLNGELEEEQTHKQWHQKFDEVVMSNGYLLNQADKCVYSKFDETGKGVIICLYVDDMLIFGTDQFYIDLTKEFLSSRFSMKDTGAADVILGSTPMDTSEKLMPNNGQAVFQLEYSRVIGCLMYAMTCTRPDIAFAVGKLSRYTSNPEGYADASWISNTEYNSSTSGWVFLLSGGAISWASKKQTCITGSTMESEFVALAAAGKEAEWLRNLILEIPLWSKPIAPISILCDNAATLANAYSQMYNGKSGHLGVRHSMIHELITNRVVSIEIVRSQQNLADHLTKRLARDLVLKSAEGMCLQFNQVVEC
ncbi:zinc finger, CCHC-type containing protein [Tanacetum coccineum]|uniref:Zinc finger, CCHC-type containing protein n=1 Tax=Tanacetum coccineum TaxID=301880 RepID=A0ABQ5AXY4_9ASTR